PDGVPNYQRQLAPDALNRPGRAQHLTIPLLEPEHTGRPPAVAEGQKPARLWRVDDAHGFGVDDEETFDVLCILGLTYPFMLPLALAQPAAHPSAINLCRDKSAVPEGVSTNLLCALPHQSNTSLQVSRRRTIVPVGLASCCQSDVVRFMLWVLFSLFAPSSTPAGRET